MKNNLGKNFIYLHPHWQGAGIAAKRFDTLNARFIYIKISI